MLLFIQHGLVDRRLRVWIQIHLMLLFICTVGPLLQIFSQIQIHLMLLFIHELIVMPDWGELFKYISCYSLSCLAIMRAKIPWEIQIHLMLLFIRKDALSYGSGQEFKYISCYSLSYPAYLLELPASHSNTSHVTLYRRILLYPRPERRIQIHLMLLFINGGVEFTSRVYSFKYISCYSLSVQRSWTS